jgi:tRNA (cmo5U34)-methyltransferase
MTSTLIKKKAVGRFAFDESVADVFGDMINRSVPGYAATLKQIGTLAAHYVQDDSLCYDLGCSLGAATLSMAQHITASGVQIISVDNAVAMLDRCREQLAVHELRVPIELICADICDLHIERASMVVLNFTLQFIPLDRRQRLIRNIYKGMISGGILVISEKFKLEDPAADAFMIEMHHAFKKDNGYSDLEISQKRSAIEDVLIPETVDVHQQRLRAAGFEQVEQWFQCFNFMSMVARKA